MIQSIIFILAMTFIPYFVGCGCILLDRKTGDIDVLEKWNFGMVLMHAIFEIVVLAGTFTKMTLKNVTVFYFAILSVAIMIVGLIGNRTKKRVFSVGKITSFSKKEMTLLLIVLVGILYQILFVCLGLQSDADDAYYVGMAMTSFQTDTISVYHPYLGTPVKLKTMANYVLSPYPIFWAMWSKVLKIHPAILMRSILPAINIAWSYVVYRLLAKKIFLTERKRIIFLLIVVLANLFGAYSDRTSAVFLLQRVWQGKGALAAILIPMLWYLLIRLRKEGENTYVYVELFVTILAACLTSSMALFLCPVLMGAFGLEYLISERRWSVVGRLILCTLPCIVLAIAEVILLYVL